MLGFGWPKHHLAVLKGDAPPGETGLEESRGVVGWLLNQVEKGFTWPKPPTIIVLRAAGKMTIDGAPDQAEWAGSWTSRKLYLFNEDSNRDAPATTFHIAYDDTYLYFAFECDDTQIVAPPKDRDEDVYMFDSVEVFLHPIKDDPRYWEIVVGAQGQLFDALHTKLWNEWGPEKGGEKHDAPGLQYAVATRPGGGGYSVEIAVPFSALPGWEKRTPKSGDTVHAMLVRIDQDGKSLAPYAFIPLLSWGHNLWNHATLELK